MDEISEKNRSLELQLSEQDSLKIQFSENRVRISVNVTVHTYSCICKLLFPNNRLILFCSFSFFFKN